MARTTKKKEIPAAPVVTRAEKKDATKTLIRETLQKKGYKHNDLIEETARLYTERFGGEETDNINDVKGRVGSVLDIMKKDGDVLFEGGMYALKGTKGEEKSVEKTEEKPKKATRGKAKKAETTEGVKANDEAKEKAEETPKKATKKTAVKSAEKVEKTQRTKRTVKAKKEETEEKQPLPTAPLQPIAPVAPITPEVAPEPIPETPAPKKRGRKPKAVAVEKEDAPVAEPIALEKEEENAPVDVTTVKAEELPIETPKAEEKETPKEAVKEPVVTAVVEKQKAEIAQKNVVMDMSFLFGDVKPAKKEVPKPVEKTEKPISASAAVEAKEEKPSEKPVKEAVTAEEKKEALPPVKAEQTEKKSEQKIEQKIEQKSDRKNEPTKRQTKEQPERRRVAERTNGRSLTADEKLREAFLKRIRSLGGDYFEYYSIYLLERYSMRNGRRLEGMRVTAGDHDGGIDGEIELTDKFGFKETIYIQSKNWDPDKGDEKLWVVGETLLQQFLGACVCRQAKQGKQHCRGIFITTSRFTPEAKRLLDTMSDKLIGYDGNDLYETAKECSFGLVQANGEWKLDERLLSGTKAFFNLY